MIRKDVLHSDMDHRVIKWSLIAATFALVVGCYAETVQHRSDLADTAGTAARIEEAPVKAVSAS